MKNIHEPKILMNIGPLFMRKFSFFMKNENFW